MVNFVVGFPHF